MTFNPSYFIKLYLIHASNFLMRLLYGTAIKMFMKQRHIILVDLPYPLSFLSYQKKKLS